MRCGASGGGGGRHGVCLFLCAAWRKTMACHTPTSTQCIVHQTADCTCQPSSKVPPGAAAAAPRAGVGWQRWHSWRHMPLQALPGSFLPQETADANPCIFGVSPQPYQWQRDRHGRGRSCVRCDPAVCPAVSRPGSCRRPPFHAVGLARRQPTYRRTPICCNGAAPGSMGAPSRRRGPGPLRGFPPYLASLSRRPSPSSLQTHTVCPPIQHTLALAKVRKQAERPAAARCPCLPAPNPTRFASLPPAGCTSPSLSRTRHHEGLGTHRAAARGAGLQVGWGGAGAGSRSVRQPTGRPLGRPNWCSLRLPDGSPLKGSEHGALSKHGSL